MDNKKTEEIVLNAGDKLSLSVHSSMVWLVHEVHQAHCLCFCLFPDLGISNRRVHLDRILIQEAYAEGRLTVIRPNGLQKLQKVLNEKTN